MGEVANLNLYDSARQFAEGANDLAQGSSGEIIEITGRVTELDGKALDNVILEIWQADAAGRFDKPACPGWGRAATVGEGYVRFRTTRRGAGPGTGARPSRTRGPHCPAWQ